MLDSDTLLLQYHLGEERSYLWAVTPDSIDSYVLPGRAEIEEKVKAFLEVSGTAKMQGMPPTQIPRPDLPSTAQAADALSQILLAPIARKLQNQRLLIIPDGALRTISFAALTVPGTDPKAEFVPLLVNHEIVYLPSASSLHVLRETELKNRTPAPKTLAVLANPVFNAEGTSQLETSALDLELELDRSALKRSCLGKLTDLPDTETEAREILKHVPPAERLVATGFDASYEFVTSPQIRQYRNIHFATHGCFDDNPNLSGIALSRVDRQGNSRKGFLRLQDIFQLDLPAELVVLSACETAKGKDIRGNGIVGLTRGFMYAGSARVVSSLWNVNDEATAELMHLFYQEMLSANKSPAAALRAAQLQMWQQKKWQNPYSWAAFTLQGEWR